MKKLFAVLIIALLLVLCYGCSRTYYGKFITLKVKNDPIDEFMSADYIVLAFENEKRSNTEDWKWEFWVYHDNERRSTYLLQARVVAGNRSYYLVEQIPRAKPKTIAHFPTQPNYDRVKERLIAHIASTEPAEF